MRGTIYVVTKLEFETDTPSADAQLASLVEVEDDIDDGAGGSIIRLRCEFDS